MANNWPIPTDLTPHGRESAELIHTFLVEKGITDHGGGGHFYSPTEWDERGEKWGLNSLLIITHDGGDHAAAFNLDYGAEELVEALRKRLRSIGVYVEQCSSWYSAVHTA
ncbi:MAG: hypothetical protein WAW17_27135 [Rhodococcus sp. (in: high G+C Gram-positive bacteria)]|uniref:hypothetical protein n=1 Tax=Rhodococcus sp. TaxID=1831 RepID=UPI003BAF2BA6